MKTKLVAFLILLSIFASFSVFADDVVLADEPIYYGQELFVRNINERTQGRQPIGLVLSGGSARALAHIGVLQYLEDKGIVPDFIIANSMGSIVACLYSAGLSPVQIAQVFELADMGKLFDFSIPVNCGLVNCDAVMAMISKIIGKDLKVEDMEIPVMFIAEDLVTKRQVRICSGDCITALKASFAMPFYMSPVEYEDHLLTDGGVANIAPVSIAFDYGTDNIVSTTFYEGKGSNLKNPVTTLNTVLDIGKRRSGMVDILENPQAIWIRCDVEDFSFMDFDSIPELITKGYESCIANYEEINKLAKKAQGVDEELEENRKLIQTRIDSFFERYNLLGHIGFLNAVSYFNIPFRSYNTPIYRLRNEMMFGLGYLGTNGNFKINPYVGLDFNVRTGSTFVNSVAGISAEVFLLDNFKIEADGNCSLNKKWNVSQAAYYKIGSFLFGQTFEARWDNTNVITAFIQYEKDKLNAVLAFESWNAKLALAASFKCDFEAKHIPLAFKLITDGETFFTEKSRSNFNFDFSGYWVYKGEKLSIAEMFFLSDFRAGLYCDCDYSVRKGFSIAAGLCSDTNLKLIGLVGMPLAVRLGYNFSRNCVDYLISFDL